MSAREKFMARFAEKKSNGLADMKFLVMNGSSMSDDDFFDAVNEIEDAVCDESRHRVIGTWERDPKPTQSALLAD